ncbi:TonB-dependent receptor [Brevundimonas sp.]|uniref:TonB-dependent receptor n=1 Tax=Brevundimonas sp. TaxID=1871086 RepID=UPI003F6F0435
MASSACIRARLAMSVSAVALFLGAGPAFAQTADPQVDPTPATLDEIIVTAQKREQAIQDVPIAVSAFSAEVLDELRIEGGSELLRAIPNVSFSKSNFSMYNFSIRGIGTKAVSASSDPAVAVSFNNTPLIRNRLFEQEYLDVERVEVLRGPQGTLYGRNATAGVVNMIPNLPGPDFEAMAKAETGNYGSLRGQAMINIPLSDTFWVRAAGSFTQRDGFDHNTFLDTEVNGRDLWSTRVSAAWEPNDRFSANLVWEHFEEDDNRSRTGKQLCTPDPGPASVGSATITDPQLRGRMSQGCLPGSLYADAAYGAPNGTGMSQVIAAGVGIGLDAPMFPNNLIFLVQPGVNPYEGIVQSRNMREIATSYDPVFRAKNDVVQINLSYELDNGITLYSQTAYAKDDYYSTQDYNRFVSNPLFPTVSQVYNQIGQLVPVNITPGGIYNDPQLGASDRMISADLSQSDNRQWYQEFRAQSDFDGGFNFSIGANYLDFQSEDNYYVFNNLFNIVADYYYNVPPTLQLPPTPVECTPTTTIQCIYVDRSPIDDLAGDGHNYFRSKNRVQTRSWSVFGEGYWDLGSTVRLTAGLRYTNDDKTSELYPSQLLLGGVPSTGEPGNSGGYYSRGYEKIGEINQSWEALTGRLVVDWRPTDDIMLYASYARGYKGGGANPPRADINPFIVQYQPLAETFEPEYVNAFEIGAKTTSLDGRLTFNATAFYSDYKDYQVSQIVDRISLNENFDARTMGVELETVYRPTPDFRIDANLGYLRTRIADGERSIDVMNRTQGDPEWMVLRPWLQVPSNCIARVEHVETIMNSFWTQILGGIFPLAALCSGAREYGTFTPNVTSSTPFWQLYGFTYDPLVDGPNGGRGFEADLSGNELPNAPRWTANIGAQYTFHITDWDLTVRGDYYRQSSSYFRVYNTEYDRIRGWDNANLSMTLENPDQNIVIQAYVKNVFDDAPIVDAFTNSDDSMLTTNVFTLDPRLIGFSIAKRF